MREDEGKAQMVIRRYRRSLRRYGKKSRIGRRRSGFTLIELMASSLITSVVLLIAWTGLISVINMSNEAQAITSRRIEMTRAVDMMTQEVRQAQAINRSGAIEANGSTVTLEDVVTSAGIDLADLGTYDHLGLYLELPTNNNITTCMTDGGSVPADRFDSVVYDVRNSPNSWLQPKAVARYGRIPDMDGSINPCSTPVANDIVADAISQTVDTPDCDGVLSGGDGFHTCQQGDTVGLLFKSSIDGVEVAPTSGAVTSRAFNFAQPAPAEEEPAPADEGDLVLTAVPDFVTGIDIDWAWSGTKPELESDYRLVATSDLPRSPLFTRQFGGRVTGYSTNNINEFSDLSVFLASLGMGATPPVETICFVVSVDTDERGTVQSNRECVKYNGGRVIRGGDS